MSVSAKSSIVRLLRQAFCTTLFMIIASIPSTSFAHGVAGQRFFPTTFAVDDPFVSDEFSVLFNSLKMDDEAGGPQVRTSSLDVGYAKRILPNFGIEVADSYQRLQTEGDGSVSGYGNLEVSAKYQFYRSASHETILSFGVSDEIGNTGSRKVGAESFSVISPAFFFGKGFGDLPDSMQFFEAAGDHRGHRSEFPFAETNDHRKRGHGRYRRGAPSDHADLGVYASVQPHVPPVGGEGRGAWRSLQQDGRDRRISDGDMPEQGL